MMLDLVNKQFEGDYDFFYLPIDLKVDLVKEKNKCNLGYAFMNFCRTNRIKDFYNKFNGKKWSHFNSDKVCDIRYARIQGLKSLTEHFKDSSVMNQQVVLTLTQRILL